MLRFAWAYQGGGGSITYLPGGDTIDVRTGARSINISQQGAVNVRKGSTALDIKTNGKALDIIHDRHSIDL